MVYGWIIILFLSFTLHTLDLLVNQEAMEAAVAVLTGWESVLPDSTELQEPCIVWGVDVVTGQTRDVFSWSRRRLFQVGSSCFYTSNLYCYTATQSLLVYA